MPPESLKLQKSKAWMSKDISEAYFNQINSQENYQQLITKNFLSGLSELHDPSTSKVLDLGCGTGTLLLNLLREGYTVDGVDISSEMVSKIRRGISENETRLYIGDIFDLSNLPYENYDLVCSRWVIGHFSNWPVILTKVFRILKPSGHFVFDITSSQNYKLALKLTRFRYEGYPFDDRPEYASVGRFYASTCRTELRQKASDAGFQVKEVRPLTLFCDNPLLLAFNDSSNLVAYTKTKQAVETLYKRKLPKIFLEWFEKKITPKLPIYMANSLRVVLQKIK